MGRTLLPLALAAALVAQQTQTPVYRVTGDLVPIFATVVDKSERLVTTLKQDDFQIIDNGKPQPIVVFDNSPAPIRLIVLLDVSGSMKGNLPLLKAASQQLFAKLGPADAARVGFFGNEITISPVFTNQSAQLMAAMPEQIEDAPTPLWEAVDKAITELKGIEQRRVVLVLSDGADSGYRPGKKFYNQLDIVDRARQEDVMVYAVGMRPRLVNTMNLQAMMDSSEPDPNLGKVALETGGGYIALRGNDDLNAAFTRVADELHSQYRLGFVPPAHDGKTHKIELRTRQPGLKVRGQKSYLAPKDPAP